jgi:hypothetical protein
VVAATGLSEDQVLEIEQLTLQQPATGWRLAGEESGSVKSLRQYKTILKASAGEH